MMRHSRLTQGSMMAMSTPVVPGGRDTDPSVLTTQQLQREITMLRELLEARLDGQIGMITRLKEAVDALPAQRHEAIEALQKLHEEKFRSIAIQFAERDTRGEQTNKDSKVAIDAALQAAKEAADKQNISNTLAIAKSEAAFIKQIDQITTLFQTTTNALRDMIDDMKANLNGMTGHSKGIGDSWGWLVGAVGMVGGLIAIFFALSKP